MRTLAWLIAGGVFLSFASAATSVPAAGATASYQKRLVAKRAMAKRHLSRRTSRYGFLPGYRPPEVIEYHRKIRGEFGPYYALPWARFYRGRWNGGGFGPCYTYTPIGPIWNCGR